MTLPSPPPGGEGEGEGARRLGTLTPTLSLGGRGGAPLSVADVAGNHLVHRAPGVADPLLAHREIDDAELPAARHLLDLLARHVSHEAGRDPAEAGHRVLGP